MTDNHMQGGSLVRYQDVLTWTDTHDLIQNRVGVINQMHGCRYDHVLGNPCVMRSRGGRYQVYYCGGLVAHWSLYDVESARIALSCVNLLNDALWNGRRIEALSLSPGLHVYIT